MSDEEVKILAQILHQWFTDEPEEEIVTGHDEIMARLPEAVAIVRKEGDADDRASSCPGWPRWRSLTGR